MTKRDLAVYPADEQLLHRLFSADCRCKPVIELVGATLVYEHNALYPVITNDKGDEHERQRINRFAHCN